MVEFADDTVPEILRCSLSSVILQLLAIGVANILTFDFMSPPPRKSLLKAVEQLYLLGAVEPEEKDKKEGEEDNKMDIGGSKGEKKHDKKKNGKDSMKKELNEEEEDYSLQLTALGRRLAHFPLEPMLSRAILASEEFGCTHEVLTVVSMLSVDSVIFIPRNKKEAVMTAHRKFVSEDGDHMTWLSVYRAYKSNKGNKVRIDWEKSRFTSYLVHSIEGVYTYLCCCCCFCCFLFCFLSFLMEKEMLFISVCVLILESITSISAALHPLMELYESNIAELVFHWISYSSTSPPPPHTYSHTHTHTYSHTHTHTYSHTHTHTPSHSPVSSFP